MKNLLVASTSTLHGGTYLAYLKEPILSHFAGCKTILFIPYARPGGISHDEYTQKVQATFEPWGISVRGIHEVENPAKAIQEAEGIFTGGGNTFVLVHALYENKLMDVLRTQLEQGTPYLGTSAGSNILGQSMHTTNDMPIAYPPKLETLGMLPFNLNPHYLDPDGQSKHMGETRETRIQEFHAYHPTAVLGLREGSWLEVKGEAITLKGDLSARLFQHDQVPLELESGTELNKWNWV
ncbi:MAG: Peptidase [Bacteroidota bacterium]|jgi:dipeptidase E